MRGLFITGTGTEIGKTFLTCALARQLSQQGRAVEVLKPVLSGFDPDDPHSVAESDPACLLRALDRPVTPEAIDEVAPLRFHAPMSPDMAARREGQRLDPEAITASITARLSALPSPESILLVEGVGGAMVPLAPGWTVRRIIEVTGLPALVITHSALGALSHTLTTVEALRVRDIPVAGVVVSASVDQPVPLEETRATLELHLEGVPVLAVPRCDPAPAGWDQVPDLTTLVR